MNRQFLPEAVAVSPAIAGPGRRPVVLVVDDEPINRALIKGLLQDSFEVVDASGGAEAVERCQNELVDLVVMDIQMPGMNGFEATRRIKGDADERFLPVIMMTASNEDRLLGEGLVRGADDFLLKPISRVLLEAKVGALLRMAEVFRVLRDQNRELTVRRAEAERDYQIAKGVFNRVAKRGRFDLPDLLMHTVSLDSFNGDVVLTATAGSTLRMLVGDFAGHGLSAAVGALPASDVFYTMSEQGASLQEVARELNGKLHRMFPRDLFLSVCLVDIDLAGERLLVWNGGLPDGLVFGRDGAVSHRLASRHPPMGILPASQVDTTLVAVPFPAGARFAIFTDGLAESRAPDGDMFGMERIEQALSGPVVERDWSRALWTAHDAFRGPLDAEDDVTFVGLTHTPELVAALAARQLPPRNG